MPVGGHLWRGKIVLDKNKRSKADFIHAVCLKRKSDSVIGASASNYVPTVNDDEVAPQASDERERAEKLVKIWCIHSPCSQYCLNKLLKLFYNSKYLFNCFLSGCSNIHISAIFEHMSNLCMTYCDFSRSCPTSFCDKNTNWDLEMPTKIQ
jgi:hypothetical protein